MVVLKLKLYDENKQLKDKVFVSRVVINNILAFFFLTTTTFKLVSVCRLASRLALAS